MKKFLGALGVFVCIALLILVGTQFISWLTFWVGIAIVAFFAYVILPRLP